MTGDELRSRRRKLGLTQVQLADVSQRITHATAHEPAELWNVIDDLTEDYSHGDWSYCLAEEFFDLRDSAEGTQEGRA